MRGLLGFAGRSRRKLVLAGLPIALGLGVAVAIAYFSSAGSGSATASVGGLSASTISATGGAGTVAVSWSTVPPPSGGGTVMYYVSRDGGAAGGNCPTAGSPTSATSCTDSGLNAGTYHYTVTAAWRSWSATSSSTAVTLASGAVDHFSLTATTTTPAAGAGDNLTITAKDSSDNTVTAYGGNQALTFGGASTIGSYHPTVTDVSGTAVSFGTAEQIHFTDGVATVSGSSNGVMTLFKAEGATITVSDGSHTGSAGVTVSPTGAAGFSIANPGGQTAGQAFSLTVTALDPYGNVATSYGGTMTLDYSGAGASPNGTAPNYPSTATSVAFANGVGSPSGVTLYGAASTTLTATDHSSPLISGQTTFTVNPSTPASISKIAGDNQSAPLNTAFATALKVTVKDAYGNTQTSGTATFAAPGTGATGNFKTSSAICNNSGGTSAGSCTVSLAGDGTATASTFTANGTNGAYSVSVTANGGSSPSVTFSLSNGQPPAITSANSTNFGIGFNGTFTVTTTGSPMAALSESGALPGGVTFHDNGNGTATVSGNPWLNSNTSYPITITANNGISPNATQSFTLNVTQFNSVGPGTYLVTVPAGSSVTVTNLCGGSGGGGSTTGAGTGGGGGCVSGTIPSQSSPYVLTVTTGSGGTDTGSGGAGFNTGGAGGGSDAGGGGGSSVLRVGATNLIVAAGGGGGSGANSKGAGSGGSGGTTSPGSGASGAGGSGGGSGGSGNGSPTNAGSGGTGSKANGGGGGAGASPGAGGNGTGNNGSTANGGGAGGDLVTTSAGSLNPIGISYSTLGTTAAGSSGANGSVTLIDPPGNPASSSSSTSPSNSAATGQPDTDVQGRAAACTRDTRRPRQELHRHKHTLDADTKHGRARKTRVARSAIVRPTHRRSRLRAGRTTTSGEMSSPSGSTVANGAVTDASTLSVSADHGIQPAGKTAGSVVVDSTTSPGQARPATQVALMPRRTFNRSFIGP